MGLFHLRGETVMESDPKGLGRGARLRGTRWTSPCLQLVPSSAMVTPPCPNRRMQGLRSETLRLWFNPSLPAAETFTGPDSPLFYRALCWLSFKEMWQKRSGGIDGAGDKTSACPPAQQSRRQQGCPALDVPHWREFGDGGG